MSKKIISIITTIALILTMIVPAMAGNGDGIGEDTFPSSVSIHNKYLLGEYTLGTEKIFKISTYASGSEGTIVNREVKITGDAEVSEIEFLDGDTWKNISEYNTQIAMKNDVERQIRVVFYTAGIYTITFTLYDTNGAQLVQSKRVISVSNDGIVIYNEPETTEPETTTEEISTTDEPTTEPESTTEPVTTTKPVETTTAPVETTTPEPVETSTVQPTETTTVVPTETTTPQPSTIIIIETKVDRTTTTAEKITAPAKAKINKVNAKKKSAKKVKLTLKKTKGAAGYQVAIYKTKKNAQKNKKAVVKKIVGKTKVTISSKKLKNNKKLYVKARAYVLDANKKKLYGKWSNIKKVKITK